MISEEFDFQPLRVDDELVEQYVRVNNRASHDKPTPDRQFLIEILAKVAYIGDRLRRSAEGFASREVHSRHWAAFVFYGAILAKER